MDTLNNVTQYTYFFSKLICYIKVVISCNKTYDCNSVVIPYMLISSTNDTNDMNNIHADVMVIVYLICQCLI